MSRQAAFATVHTEGGLLSSDLLTRVAANDRELKGLRPEDYHLARGERLGELATRAWNRLTGAWKGFAEARAEIPAGDAATTLTRERWLLVLFSELGYGRLQSARAFEVGGKSYPISHIWGNLPIHLVGAGVDLDSRRAGVRGAAGGSPHSLVQEFLNRSDDHLWAIVTNGLRLRLLRDNASLTRQAYVEFDLETMMADEVFEDFVVLFLLCHQSRLEGDDLASSWLEAWSKEAAASGTRALESLRGGVKEAITALGGGFLAHPANQALRDGLRSGELDAQDYYRQLLRTVYRLIFLFVAEDRELLHADDVEELAKRRYSRYYSLDRIREIAGRSRGGPHPDLWAGLGVAFTAFGRSGGEPRLGLPALGSFLWSGDACPDLGGAQLANRDLLSAVRALTFTRDQHDKVLRPVDWRNLGSEELGSVYESLLELHPEVEADGARFSLATAAGNERKVTGSYYTPTSLISALLDSALDPVLDEAADQPTKTEAEAAILAMRVLDPACGSGHFLIAAAHRIAKRLAQVRTGDNEPGPAHIRTAVRDVIGRCLHGIDINPMSVELCKVSLWMESIEPGKPLSFLEHRIVCGNSLLGTTPALLAKGIPDEAFKPLEGDDPKVVTGLRKTNHIERAGQQTLALGAAQGLLAFGRAVADLDAVADTDLADVEEKERRFAELQSSAAVKHARLLADAWCAAFVLDKRPGAPVLTHGVFDRLRRNLASLSPDLAAAIEDVRSRYRFLHLHLAFPHVFGVCNNGNATKGTGWTGGFGVVLGNPPWDQVQYDPREVFEVSHPEIANASNMAKRNRLIEALLEEDPKAHALYRDGLRTIEGVQHFIHASDRYPLTSYGRLNTAPLFVETMRTMVAPRGCLGVVAPTGIATDSFNQRFFADLVEHHSLASLFDFENRERIFPSVDSRMKFCLLTVTGADRPVEAADFVFFAHRTSDVADSDRRFTLTPEDFALLNPNTRTCPVFRSRRDAELTKQIYRRVPILIREGAEEENPWGVHFQIMFMMNTDSHRFRSASECETEGACLSANVYEAPDGRRWLPLYEAKMLHHFTHRWGDYAMQKPDSKDTQLPDVPDRLLADPSYCVQPRYWVEGSEVAKRASGWKHAWAIGFRRISNVTNERTAIFTVLPEVAAGDSIFLFLQDEGSPTIVGGLNSFVFDFVVRQKMGGTNLNFFYVKQLPLIQPEALGDSVSWQSDTTVSEWLRPYVLELNYTTWDLEAFAAELKYDGPPFRHDEDRRALLRAELDACFFHLYGLEPDDVDYVMDTFPIVRRKDEERYGEYRTKRLILEAYDAMAKAAVNGKPFVSMLDPPPADPRVAHRRG